MFGSTGSKPTQEEIHMGGFSVILNHVIKVAFVAIDNPDMTDEDIADLRKHMKKRGYHVELVKLVEPPPKPLPHR